MTLNKIKNIIFNSDQNNEDCLPNFEDDFKKLGYSYEVINVYENDDNRQNIKWNQTFRITKNEKAIDIYMEGTACAEESYGKWTHNSNYSYDIEDVTISESIKIVNEKEYKTYDLFLYGNESYQHYPKENVDQDVYFKNLSYMITNDENIANKDKESYQFSEKDLKKINICDFFNDILYYTNFLEKIDSIKSSLNLNYDFNKFNDFNSLFKEHILYDNGKEDLNELISIIYYKNEEIGYLFDKRGKRDNTDYFYFKNNECLEKVLKYFINTFDDKSKEILNFDKLIPELIESSCNLFNKSYEFKTAVNFITKEEYEEKTKVFTDQDIIDLAFDR